MFIETDCILLAASLTLVMLNATLFDRQYWGWRSRPLAWGMRIRQLYLHGREVELTEKEPDLTPIASASSPRQLTYILARLITSILTCGWCLGFWVGSLVFAFSTQQPASYIEAARAAALCFIHGIVTSALAGVIDHILVTCSLRQPTH